MAENHENDDKSIEIWKIKKLMKSLEASRGNETIIISLIIPPHDQIYETTKLLDNEYETASIMKSRMNQQSILAAITSAQQRLKLYSKIPPNGLVLYTGTIVTQDNKKKKFTIDFEPPFRPINASSLYLCDNKFHAESLNQVLEFDEKFGFIVMDAHGTLFGTLKGNTREVLDGFPMNLDLNRGRPLSHRVAHLPMKKCPDYLRKSVELATKCFINPSTNQPNVTGLILAACPGFKTALGRISMFDPQLRAKIVNRVDVSIGGEMGFIQAIELSSEMRANVKLNQEKLVIEKYFEEIRQKKRSGKYVCGVDKTVNELETGAIETLIVWEDLEVSRYVLKNSTSGEVVIRYSKKEEEENIYENIKGNNNKELMVVEEKMCLVEWLANEYKRFGFSLQIVTNKTQQGFEFCTSFDGIGAILCYPLEN